MTGDSTAPTTGTAQADLGDLLAGAVQAVVSAQDALDRAALQRVQAFGDAAPGTLSLPPLAFAFDAVRVDIELSAQVVSTSATADAPARSSLLCRTLNPVTAGLFGYSASAGTKVSVSLSPTRVCAAPGPAVD
jgi:hypothetical protein